MQRMASRSPALQMPPLGTELVDRQAMDLIERWITQSEPAPQISPTKRKETRQ
jgi:hypothetical protein